MILCHEGLSLRFLKYSTAIYYMCLKHFLMK